jgi:predicted ribosome quality control (RQC) complex YloA/Tae2 family protein
VGLKFSKAFSQNKDELIIQFESGLNKKTFFLKCLMSPEFACLSFPDDFHRKRKNSVELFSELRDLEVTKVYQFENERAFSIKLLKGYTLVFKLFGSRSNILVFKGDQNIDMFHKKMESDVKLSINLDREIEYPKEDFVLDPDLQKWFPTLRGLPESYLQEKGYEPLSPSSKWEMIIQTLDVLNKGDKYYLLRVKDKHHISLLPFGEVIEEFDKVSDACNKFFRTYMSIDVFSKYKRKILSSIASEILRSENYIEKTKKKLDRLKEDTNYQQIGDVLMANIHKIKSHGSVVTLQNIYTGKDIEIKLKPGLSPQKNAETYYRKSKNQFKELNALKENIDAREYKLAKLRQNEKMVCECSSRNDLDELLKKIGAEIKSKSDQVVLPYLEKEILGFKILVGKNAKSNDLLLNTYSRKEDLWLHVKDAPGSHVLIKYQSGKKFFKELIDQAARIAAFHSKRKSESLVPVAYTERKFVRKRKGDVPGLAVVEREKVVLVEPTSIP